MILDYKISDLSLDDEEYLLDAKDEFTLKRRVKKKFNLYNGNKYIYFNEHFKNNDLRRCSFCGELCSFNLSFYIKEHVLYCKIVYNKEIYICQHNQTEKSKKCPSKKLNPNSIEFVSHAYNLTEAEANNLILKRNKSPFYRTNYSSDEEYMKYQKRDKKWYLENSNIGEYNKKCEKIKLVNSKKYLIEKYGLDEANKICKKKDSMSKEHFKNKYGDNWEEEYKDRLKSVSNLNINDWMDRGYSYFEALDKVNDIKNKLSKSNIEYKKSLSKKILKEFMELILKNILKTNMVIIGKKNIVNTSTKFRIKIEYQRNP